MFHHDPEGPPCRRMESLLQEVADGSATGIRRWYAVAHAARCGHCGNFLSRMTRTIAALRATPKEEKPEALDRLMNGDWRSVDADSATPAEVESKN